MPNDSQYELLSAYLDGELTAAEKARVEELLSADPVARQLLEELRSLSSALKSLPRQTLGTDLSESVLRIAKQRQLAGSAAVESPAPLSARILRRLNNPRIWFWEAVIVAAAGMLLMFIPNRNFVPQGGDAERVPAVALARKAEKEQPRLSSEEAPAMQAARSETSGSGTSALGGKIAAREAPTVFATVPADEKPREEPHAAIESSGELLVVRCEITANALNNHAFDKLLEANQILFWSEKVAEEADYHADADKMRSKAQPTEAVLVEAPPERVEALLNGLSAQKQAFSLVAVSPKKGIGQFGGSDYRADRLGGERSKAYRALGDESKIVEQNGVAMKAKTALGMASPVQQELVLGRARRVAIADFRNFSENLASNGKLEKQFAADKPASATAPQTLQRVLFIMQVVEEKAPAADHSERGDESR